MYGNPLTDAWNYLTGSVSEAQAAVACGPGMVGDLCRAVDQQVRLSEQGSSLPNGLAGGPSQFLIDAPANNLGAAWRAAYWLATASRVALGRSNPAGQQQLLAAAKTARGRAVRLVAGKFSIGLFTTSPTGDGKIRSILRDAEQQIRGQGIQDVANILAMQQQRSAIEQSQLMTAGQGTMTVPGINPESLVRGGVMGVAGVSILAAVVMIGVGVWFFWPWIAPIFGAARGVVRTRSKQNRRRKKRRRSRR